MSFNLLPHILINPQKKIILTSGLPKKVIIMAKASHTDSETYWLYKQVERCYKGKIV